jgi:hypothetical protein
LAATGPMPYTRSNCWSAISLRRTHTSRRRAAPRSQRNGDASSRVPRVGFGALEFLQLALRNSAKTSELSRSVGQHTPKHKHPRVRSATVTYCGQNLVDFKGNLGADALQLLCLLSCSDGVRNRARQRHMRSQTARDTPTHTHPM